MGKYKAIGIAVAVIIFIPFFLGIWELLPKETVMRIGMTDLAIAGASLVGVWVYATLNLP